MPSPPTGPAATARAPHRTPGTGDGSTVHGRIKDQAALRPDAPALRTMAGERLSYAELCRRAAELAGLLREDGVGPGHYVVVRMRRTPGFVVALLGILETGAAYIAVDWNWPAARVQQIIDTSRAHLLAEDGEGPGSPLVPATDRRRLSPHRPPPAAPKAPPPGRAAEATPQVDRDAPCTVFFTSGSTGEPKGSVTAHRAIVHRFVDVSYADFGPGRLVLQAAPVCWDAMTIELWSVLMNGGTSLLLDQERVVSPDLLRDLVQGAGLDTLWLTASLFNAVVDDDPLCLSGVRQVLTGGEKLSPEHIARFRAAHPAVRLVNGYGPVETAVFATTWTVGDDDAERYGQIPLGTPLPHTSVHVLTSRGTPAAPGERGEICVGGRGLALGYLARPELTEQCFVTLASGERVYRTGDTGWWHPDGVLLYGGRRDRQVKIRGQRVEPEEVERYLEGLAPVRRARVGVVRAPDGRARDLVAHCVAPDLPDAAELIAACARDLPPYLRPGQVLLHDAFPLTASGKVDARALEQLALAARPRPGTAARPRPVPVDGPLAAALAELRELLSVEVGPDDDLVALGIDSITTMRLVSRLTVRHLARVPFGAVQELRTPRAIIARAEPATAPGAGRPPTTQVTDSRVDLWLREQFSPGDPAQLIVRSFGIRPAVDRQALRTALDTLTGRHPALRTGYRMRGAAVHAEPLPDPAVPVRDVACPPRGADVPWEAPREWLAPFDLAHDAPARCLVAPVPGGSLLTLVIHHIAYDGWSEHVLLTELGAAYDAARTGRGGSTGPRPARDPVRPAPPTAQERERSRARWRRSLDGSRPLDLPPGRGDAGRRLEEIRLPVPAPDVRRLRESAAADPHITALTWYGVALHRLTGEERFSVGSYFAGRDGADEKAIGYFVRPMPVALDFRGGPPRAAVAAAARRRWAEAVAAPVLSLDDLADLAPRPSRFGLPPVFQAALAFQNAPAGELRLSGHRVERLDVPQPAAPLPLALQIWPQPDGGWDARVQADPTLVDRAILPRLAAHLVDELHQPPAHDAPR
ncbi:amino acid adenylation domain-containing protein [Streptomyces sp. NBC_00433]